MTTIMEHFDTSHLWPQVMLQEKQAHRMSTIQLHLMGKRLPQSWSWGLSLSNYREIIPESSFMVTIIIAMANKASIMWLMISRNYWHPIHYCHRQKKQYYFPACYTAALVHWEVSWLYLKRYYPGMVSTLSLEWTEVSNEMLIRWRSDHAFLNLSKE